MNNDQRKFLDLLFDKNQGTCFTSKAWGTTVRTFPLPHDVFFSINAIHTDKDLEPTEEYHRANKPRRADANVYCFRNFLIELDDYPLDKQIEYVTSVLPVSTIVFSGKKSYHFIISLETPLESYEKYMEWSRALLSKIPKADQVCKNPSRLSRLPGSIRPDTDKRQELIYINGRIPNSIIYDLIKDSIIAERSHREVSKTTGRVSVDILKAVEMPDKLVLSFGSRNKFFYWLFNRCKELGIDKDGRQKLVDRAYDNLIDTRDFSIREAYMAARLRY